MVSVDVQKLSSTLFKQGYDDTICFAAATLNGLVLRDPSKIDQAASELRLTGRTRLGNLELTSNDNLKRLASANYRRWGVCEDRALLLLALAEAMNGDLILTTDNQGNIGSMCYRTGNFILGGKIEWVAATNSRIMGSSLYLREQMGTTGFEKILPKVQQGSLLSLIWDEISQSRHLLVVAKVENGRVYFLDSIPTSCGYFRSLFDSARVDGANVWSVELSELCASGRIRYVVAQQGLAPVDLTFRDHSAQLQLVEGLENFCVAHFLESKKQRENRALRFLERPTD